VLVSKEAQFEQTLAETRSKADWDVTQLRHLLDKADINYANNVEIMNERFEKETGSLDRDRYRQQHDRLVLTVKYYQICAL
jgi:hypothetical protein